jgi:hypothetical protein
MKAAEHVRANANEDGLVILDIDKGEIFSANIVAARIWTMLMEGKSVAEINDALIGEFAVERATVEVDTNAFITSLVEKSLVTD